MAHRSQLQHSYSSWLIISLWSSYNSFDMLLKQWALLRQPIGAHKVCLLSRSHENIFLTGPSKNILVTYSVPASLHRPQFKQIIIISVALRGQVHSYFAQLFKMVFLNWSAWISRIPRLRIALTQLWSFSVRTVYTFLEWDVSTNSVYSCLTFCSLPRPAPPPDTHTVQFSSSDSKAGGAWL